MKKMRAFPQMSCPVSVGNQVSELEAGCKCKRVAYYERGRGRGNVERQRQELEAAGLDYVSESPFTLAL
jgi:hypothetical protein